MAAVVVGSAAVADGVELGVFTLLGGLAGIIVVRRGERVQQFVQAGLVMAVVNVPGRGRVQAARPPRHHRHAPVVGRRPGRRPAGRPSRRPAPSPPWATCSASPPRSSCWSSAIPSQPLLRRLLLEAPGTYHHSLMVGNLAERAAEAIDADPLVVRVAAYYHDIGKLGEPECVHREPGRPREPPRRADAGAVGRAHQQRMSPTASTSPTSTSCPSRSSRSSRSTTARRS